MSSVLQSINYGKNPIFWVFVAAGAAVFAVVYTQFGENLIGSLLAAAVVIGLFSMLYNDYVEKKKMSDIEEQKQEALLKRKEEQMKAELDEGKCISCLAPLGPNDEKCPKCGFEVRHYKMEKPEPIKENK